MLSSLIAIKAAAKKHDPNAKSRFKPAHSARIPPANKQNEDPQTPQQPLNLKGRNPPTPEANDLKRQKTEVTILERQSSGDIVHHQKSEAPLSLSLDEKLMRARNAREGVGKCQRNLSTLTTRAESTPKSEIIRGLIPRAKISTLFERTPLDQFQLATNVTVDGYLDVKVMGNVAIDRDGHQYVQVFIGTLRYASLPDIEDYVKEELLKAQTTESEIKQMITNTLSTRTNEVVSRSSFPELDDEAFIEFINGGQSMPTSI